MKINLPKSFTFEAGPRAVLLLHGLTGHTADVRMLGRFLEKKGYTSHAPIYRGHGLEPEALMESNAEQWWKDAEASFDYLLDKGYKEIAVAGLSLGGVFSLKLAATRQAKGVIPMCAPMFHDNERQLTFALRKFAKEFKQLQKKDAAVIETEVAAILVQKDQLFSGLKTLIEEVNALVDTIYTPTFVVQARQDEIINTDSADFIYEHVQSDEKEIKWYEDSTHVITLSKQKEELHEDIYQFLESLDWSV